MTPEEQKRLQDYRTKATLSQSDVGDYFRLIQLEREAREKVVVVEKVVEVVELVVKKARKNKAK